nr:immunoglobulin heavy chain junction region [Mus musculus]
CAKGGFFAYW